MASDDFRKAQSIIDFYIKSYKDKFGSKPIINRYKLKFIVVDALRDFSPSEMEEIIKYFIKSRKVADINELFYNIEDIIEEKKNDADHIKQRKQLLSDTEKSVREFRERYKKSAE